VGFFIPFDDTRYFLPWRPIRVSPLALSRIFSMRFWAVLGSEVRWIVAPAMIFSYPGPGGEALAWAHQEQKGNRKRHGLWVPFGRSGRLHEFEVVFVRLADCQDRDASRASRSDTLLEELFEEELLEVVLSFGGGGGGGVPRLWNFSSSLDQAFWAALVSPHPVPWPTAEKRLLRSSCWLVWLLDWPCACMRSCMVLNKDWAPARSPASRS